MNPVAEAEFLAAAKLPPKLYNLFDSGGYLLWRLDPRYKMMVDQRSFPYLSWYDDQRRFTRGETFDAFLAKYPADVAVIDLANPIVLRPFATSPAWTLAYFGPAAAVFVKTGTWIYAAAQSVRPDRFASLRNPMTALYVFDFAVLAGDLSVAWTALDQMEKQHRFVLDAKVLAAAAEYREGYRALAAGRFQEASARLSRALGDRPLSPRDRRIRELLGRVPTTPDGDGAVVDAIAAELRSLAVLPE